jgi:hypothetical protein
MNQTHPNPEGNRGRDQAGCRQPPRLPVPPAAAPYTHPVHGTQQVQQYPFPQTAPGTTGHLPPKKRPGWRIAVGVALALVALLVLVAAITAGRAAARPLVRPTQNTGSTRADAQGRAGEMRPDRPTRRHCLAELWLCLSRPSRMGRPRSEASRPPRRLNRREETCQRAP